MSDPENLEASELEFDFGAHRSLAVESYRSVQGTYADLAATVRGLLQTALTARGLKVHSIEHRAKSDESFGDKAVRVSDEDSNRPKYANPLDEIHDLAGCRVITFFLHHVDDVRAIINAEFTVRETANRSSHLRGSGRPGYESYHFVVELSQARLALPEYARYRGMRVEIQVRTILQHAWAEIEHDIQYKSVDALPAEIGQRFMALAGMIEIGDREFQAIADAHDKVREKADISLKAGRLEDVELTAESLKSYVDKIYGPDGRMRDWSYEWTATLLKRLGFLNLAQLDECTRNYDDDLVSRAVWGSRQGQLTRLELVVLAAVGPERYKTLHPFATSESNEDSGWFEKQTDRFVERLKKSGIPIGSYLPSPSGATKPRA